MRTMIVSSSEVARLGTMSPRHLFWLIDQITELDRLYSLIERCDPSYQRPADWNVRRNLGNPPP